MTRTTATFALLLFSLVIETSGDDGGSNKDPLSDAQHQQLKLSLDKMKDEATKRIEERPAVVDGYSLRGDAHFFLGQFNEAVADYDKTIEIDDSLKASHWRRGIALFYAERYSDAATQFENYHSFDQVDRENGIWRYLSQVRAIGREKAREGLLKYQKDDREPFPSVYQLFAGKTTPAEILNRIDSNQLSKGEHQKRLFYAQLYIGLNHAVENENEPAHRHLAEATRISWPITAGYGPHFMWHVGRLHEELLRKKLEE